VHFILKEIKEKLVEKIAIFFKGTVQQKLLTTNW
jgi:hypothetical protein